MHSFYPQAGVRYNPIFTDLQFASFARDVEDHAAQLYQMAFAAFARAADGSQGSLVVQLNFGLLTQFGDQLLALHRLALADSRVNDRKVGQHLNLLFWAFIGAGEELLRFEDDGNDWEKDWRSAFVRGGLIGTLAAELALAGAATGSERDEMMGCLSRLRGWACKARDYHLHLMAEVLEDADDLIALVREAGRLMAIFDDAEVALRARGVVEATRA